MYVCCTYLLTVLLLWWLVQMICICWQSTCNLKQLPTIPLTLTAFIDLESVAIVTGWILLQALLASVPIGFVTTGPLLPDGRRLKYRGNGLCWQFVIHVLTNNLLNFHHCSHAVTCILLHDTCIVTDLLAKWVTLENWIAVIRWHDSLKELVTCRKYIVVVAPVLENFVNEKWNFVEMKAEQ